MCVVLDSCFVESVDPICRDRMGRQYESMQMVGIHQNMLKSF